MIFPVRNKNNNDSHQNNVKTDDLDEEITSKSIFKTEYIKECQTNEEKEREDRINKLLDQGKYFNLNKKLLSKLCKIAFCQHV